MSSSLSAIPIAKRRHLAAVLGLFSTLFVTIGLVAWLGRVSTAIVVFSSVALVTALVLGAMAWGVIASVKNDLAEARLDRAIEAGVTASGGTMCDCGHDHDPNEMHVTGAPCAHDGSGDACAHDCDSCALQALRSTSAPDGRG